MVVVLWKSQSSFREIFFMEASLCADVGVVELGPGVGVFGVVALVGGVKSC